MRKNKEKATNINEFKIMVEFLMHFYSNAKKLIKTVSLLKWSIIFLAINNQWIYLPFLKFHGKKIDPKNSAEN